MSVMSEPLVEVRVDRVACTGHGVCAQLLEGFGLDAHGYPIVDDPRAAPAEARRAVTLCPARALYVKR